MNQAVFADELRDILALWTMEMIVSAATDRLNDILVELPKYRSQWETNVANPYVRAYDLAVDNFQKTTKAQEARDRMLAELFVFSASVLTGSIMMAAFATTSCACWRVAPRYA